MSWQWASQKMPTLWGGAGTRVCWDCPTQSAHMAAGMRTRAAQTLEEFFCHVPSVKPSAAGLEWSGEMEQWVAPALMNTHPMELVCQTTKTCNGAGGQQGKELRSGMGR